MSSTGTILFALGGIGILTGFVVAGVWSLDQLRDTDTRANEMVSPSMPPMPPISPPPLFPPSPFNPPSAPPPTPSAPARRLLNEKTVFKFTAEEEKKIMRGVRSSLVGMKH